MGIGSRPVHGVGLLIMVSAKRPDSNKGSGSTTMRKSSKARSSQGSAGGTGHGERAGSARRATKPQGSFEDYSGARALLNPLWCYHAFRVVVVILTIFGVVMVFSSSAVSLISAGSSPWKQALSQGIYCVIGFFMGFVATRIPARVYQKYGVVFVLAAIFVQLLTLTPLGYEVYGNRGWIRLGSFTMQPAEIIKLALCIWMPGALQVAVQRYKKDGIKVYALVLGGFLFSLASVLLGKDLGTSLIIILIGAVALLISDFPRAWLSGIALALVALVAAVVISSPNRMKRIFATYQCSTQDAQNVCYQAIHAKYAMGSGGLLGVGIGNSREKWNYLPEAHNDFIFAIIGEEMGFLGTLAVIFLFVVLGWSMMSIALQTANHYVSMSLVCITVWIVGQALLNIMVVVGLWPVMGVPMPFISAGGSSLIMCLVAAGVAVSLMREQPQIKADTSALSS